MPEGMLICFNHLLSKILILLIATCCFRCAIITCLVSVLYIHVVMGSLSADGKRTLLVDLDSADVKPEGWDNLQDEKPNLLSFSDVSIYELHVRDFR